MPEVLTNIFGVMLAQISPGSNMLAVACLFSTGIAVRSYRRFFRAIEGLFGAVFGLVGGKLVIDGISALR